MGSIVLGIWAIVFSTGFINGFLIGYKANIIENDISNIQIHNPEFRKDFDIKYSIPNGLEKAEAIRGWENVVGATSRTIVNGMIASPKKGAGVQIRGIDLENEAVVTSLDSMISEGTYFVGIKRNPVIIGKDLAEDLQVTVRKKVVLTFKDASGEITSAAFRVVGIVESTSLGISRGYAFVRQEDLTRLIGQEGMIHQIAILTDSRVTEEDSIVAEYNAHYDGDKAESWREIAPELAMMDEMFGSMMYVLMGIVMAALAFGIVNTMLMAVLERTRELGMLMAVGMNKMRVFTMVLVETIFLAIVGGPIGLALGWLTMNYFSTAGVDLTAYSEGLKEFGYASILYPYMENGAYFSIAIGVVITAFVAAIYPAYKAIKLKPVEALHTI